MKSVFLLIVGLFISLNSALAAVPPDNCGAFLAQENIQYKDCQFSMPAGEPNHDLWLKLAYTVRWPNPNPDGQYSSTWDLEGGNIQKVTFIYGRNHSPIDTYTSKLRCSNETLKVENKDRTKSSIWMGKIINLSNGKAHIQLNSEQHAFAVDAICNR